MKNNIRSKYVKDSLLDYEKLSNSLKEITENAVKDLLGETVRKEYNQIMSESFDKDFEESEVEDTTSKDVDTDSNDASNDETATETSTETDVVTDDSANGAEEGEGGDESAAEVSDDAVTKVSDGSEGEGNEWSEFDDYKVGDDEYDFTNAKDDEIVKVYKLMSDEDQMVVVKDGDMLHLTDNENGADYIIDLESVPDVSDSEGADENAPLEDDGMADDTEDNEQKDDIMNEQKIFEIVLNEFDSHMGYTDNYQKKDVMTNNGMKEPANSKSTNDWDAGVPKGTEKPWSGKKDKTNAPFNGEKGKTIEEEDELEEANLSQSRFNDTHAVHNRVPAANGDEYRRQGMQKTSKGTKYRATGSESTNEAIVKKANAIFEENKQLKKALADFRATLSEAAVTNVNLGKIIKLLSENTTTMDEKKEIIARFGKEAKTVEQSNALYESISAELKKKATMNINEEKQFTANSSKMINETQIYKSKDVLDTLDMMHRVCR